VEWLSTVSLCESYTSMCYSQQTDRQNFHNQWITRVLPLGVNHPLVSNSRRGSDSMDSAQHAHTFPRRVAGNDVYVCPYKHIFRLHPQHMCRRSCHSHHSTYAKLFWYAFRHFSFLCFILSVHISVSNFQLYTTIFYLKYYAFYLFYLFFSLFTLKSSFLPVLFALKHIHITKIRSLNTSQLS
jgi:hypothetical protein